MRDADQNSATTKLADTAQDSVIASLQAQLEAGAWHNNILAWLDNKVPLTDSDLRQIDEHWVAQLELIPLRSVAVRLLSELRVARDRLNQNPTNSSRPSSSKSPWDCGEKSPEEPELPPTTLVTDGDAERGANESATPGASPTKPVKKKAGKQPGAPGFGRTQELTATKTEQHYPTHCVACGALPVPESAIAYSGWYQVDVAKLPEGQIGLLLDVCHHLIYKTVCPCGHITHAQPYVAPPDALWDKVEVGQWRLIGPRLAGVIVHLAMRSRMSRDGIQEFFAHLLGLELSTGVIDEAIREAGRCCAPLEDELVQNIQDAALLFGDETPWKEKGKGLWLWVFVTRYACLYSIGFRSMEILDNVLADAFHGTLMSDGYKAYRHLKNRLRCWAHLLRKLLGLAESSNGRVAGVGRAMLDIMEQLMEAIYAARASPKPGDAGLASQYATEIARLKALCENHQHDSYAKLREVAREFLLDWTVILRQVDEPHLPLTNNDAERALRHWVIARRINQGTRSEAGTRAYALLASVIETCRARSALPWVYITEVIAAARVGAQVPQLPPIPVGE